MKYTFRWISDSNELDLVWNEYLNILNQSVNDKAILGFNSNALSFDIFKKFVEIHTDIGLLTTLLVYHSTEQPKLIATCQIKTSFQDTSKHIADIQKGIIDKNFRGTEVLPMTLKEIVRYCDKKNIDILTLDVRENTIAHRTWLRYGFKTYGILPSYSYYEGNSFNGVFMYTKNSELSKLLYSFIET